MPRLGWDAQSLVVMEWVQLSLEIQVWINLIHDWYHLPRRITFVRPSYNGHSCCCCWWCLYYLYIVLLFITWLWPTYLLKILRLWKLISYVLELNSNCGFVTSVVTFIMFDLSSCHSPSPLPLLLASSPYLFPLPCLLSFSSPFSFSSTSPLSLFRFFSVVRHLIIRLFLSLPIKTKLFSSQVFCLCRLWIFMINEKTLLSGWI